MSVPKFLRCDRIDVSTIHEVVLWECCITWDDVRGIQDMGEWDDDLIMAEGEEPPKGATQIMFRGTPSEPPFLVAVPYKDLLPAFLASRGGE